MDTNLKDLETVESVLRERAQFYATPEKFRTVPIFDRQNQEFLLLDEGWDGYQRIHRVWAHIELRDDQIWIQEDGTEDGLAADLIAAGIPRERIVLAFQQPQAILRAA